LLSEAEDIGLLQAPADVQLEVESFQHREYGGIRPKLGPEAS